MRNRVQARGLTKEGEDLFKIIKSGNSNHLRLFLNKNQKIVPEIIDSRDSVEETPMHWAAKRGKIELIQILCLYGASLDLEDITGRTPIMVAQANRQGKAADLIKAILNMQKYHPEESRMELFDRLYPDKNPFKTVSYTHLTLPTIYSV
eukprot:TRINITY_DN13922_c0_g1_i1.p1 TRINITY_DN13922_c0_g1~~TRINITY_DN13922_c0_g1_i1.p1  ORF type:complete len:149 (-),score=29.81 TRINITY_DN13922_c0_g1_i1:35-481(-)